MNRARKASHSSKQGLYGVSIAYGAGDFYDVDVANNTTPYDPLPVLKSDYCQSPIFRRNSYGVTIFRTQVAITDKAKNPPPSSDGSTTCSNWTIPYRSRPVCSASAAKSWPTDNTAIWMKCC